MGHDNRAVTSTNCFFFPLKTRNKRLKKRFETNCTEKWRIKELKMKMSGKIESFEV